MNGRLLLLPFGLLGLILTGGANADKPKKPQADEEVLQKQQTLAKGFGNFKKELLRTRQRLEKGSPEEKESAKALQNVIAAIEKFGFEAEFTRLIDFLKAKSLANPENASKASEYSRKLALEMERLTAALTEDQRAVRYRQERVEAAGFSTQFEKLIRAQKAVRAQTEKGTAPFKDLRLAQGEVRWQTEQLARQLGAKSQAVRKRMETATGHQVNAEKDLAQKRAKEALQNQDRVMKSLDETRQELARFSKQSRAMEIVYVLRLLEQRCSRMQEMQKRVREGTLALDKAIARNRDKKPNRADQREAAKLAEKEAAIVREATEMIWTVAASGSAVGLTEVLKQVRADLVDVQRLLERSRVGHATQEIEKDTIEILDEMVKILKQEQVKKKPKGVRIPDPDESKAAKTIIDLRDRLHKLEADQRAIGWMVITAPNPLRCFCGGQE